MKQEAKRQKACLESDEEVFHSISTTQDAFKNHCEKLHCWRDRNRLREHSGIWAIFFLGILMKATVFRLKRQLNESPLAMNKRFNYIISAFYSGHSWAGRQFNNGLARLFLEV